MASALGSLVVRLGLDSAEFTTGLTRSERQAEAFAKKIDAQFKSIGRFIATLGIGYAVAAFVKDTISAASALDDLSDATGSSVENLSKLANQAKISGTDFATLENLVLKLSAGMAGIDDESKEATRALQFLGVTATDPAEALQQVAVSLDKYADGVGKVALAKALFGKEGPKFLATLKDIAALQDVAATTSARQAQEAEKLEQALRRLSIEGTALKNVILTDLVPATTKLLEQFTEGIRLAGGFWNALRLFSTLPMVGNVNDAAEALTKLNQRINDIEAGKGMEGITARLTGQTARIVADLKTQRAFLELQLRQQIDAVPGKKGGAADDLTVKPPAIFSTADKAAKARVGVDEFARALESVTKAEAAARIELEAFLTGTGELTNAQRELAKIMADDSWKKFTATQRETLEARYKNLDAIQKEIDKQRQLREEREKQIKVEQDLIEVQARARDQVTKRLGDYADQTRAMERELEIVGQGDAAHKKLALTLEHERNIREAIAAGDVEAAGAFEQQYQRRLQIADSFDAASKAIERAREEARQTKQFTDAIGESFASAAEDAIVFGRSAKDVLKALEQDLLRIITRKLVTQPLSNMISSFIGGFFPGGTGGPLAGLSGGGMGAPGFASGTNYAPGGWAWVGEHGRELVNLPRGSQVIPNHEARRMGSPQIVIGPINVLPGATKQSAAQAADAQTRKQLQAARNR